MDLIYQWHPVLGIDGWRVTVGREGHALHARLDDALAAAVAEAARHQHHNR